MPSGQLTSIRSLKQYVQAASPYYGVQAAAWSAVNALYDVALQSA